MGSCSDDHKRNPERNEYKEKPYSEVNLKFENPDQVQIKCNGKTLSLSRLLREKEEPHSSLLCEEIIELQRIGRDHTKRVRAQVTELGTKKRRLDSWSKKSNKEEEFEREKLQQEDKTKMENVEDTNNFRDPEINDEKLRRAFREETRKLQKLSDEHIKRFCKQEIELENMKRQLASQSEELNKREEFLERERQKLEEEKRKMESSSDANYFWDAEMNEYKENLGRAFDEEARELQKLIKKHIKRVYEQDIELENKKWRLDSREELNKREEFLRRERRELEDEKCKREKEMLEEERLELQWNLEYNKQKFEYCDEIERMPKMWQEAFEKLIAGFYSLLASSGTNIVGIRRRMGGVDEKSWCNSVEESGVEADEICSFWQGNLKIPEWNPFKIVVNKRGHAKILINEDDDLLRGLKDRWGAEVYDNAVITALKELQFNKLNRFRDQFPLLWNFIENKEATVKDVIAYIIVQLRTLKHATP